MKFHIGDLLTVTTKRLVSPSHMDGLYAIVDYMTGVQHYTHQLPRATEVCTPALVEQHPWLAEVTVPEDLSGEQAVAVWVAGMIEKHGEMHEVEPLPSGAYSGRDPIAEMVEMSQGKPVIVVEVPEQ